MCVYICYYTVPQPAHHHNGCSWRLTLSVCRSGSPCTVSPARVVIINTSQTGYATRY